MMTGVLISITSWNPDKAGFLVGISWLSRLKHGGRGRCHEETEDTRLSSFPSAEHLEAPPHRKAARSPLTYA